MNLKRTGIRPARPRPCSAPAAPPSRRTAAGARARGRRRAGRQWRRHHRHRPEALGESAERADQHPGARHPAARGAERRQFPGLYAAAAEHLLPDLPAGHDQRLHPRRRLGRRRQPFGLAAERRRLSRRAAGDDDRRHARRPHLRHRPHRGAARAAGHALRRLVGSRHDPDHHQPARPVRLLRRGRRRAQHGPPRRHRRLRSKAMSTRRSATRAAVRLVGWYQHDAGYIDNVPGTRAFLPPAGGIVINNNALVENDYNDVDTVGGRAALGIDLDENWTVTASLFGQDQRSHGSFGFDPAVGDLQVQHFFPDRNHDRFAQAALTVEGKIGNFDLTYAGAYLDRQIHSSNDYTDYAEAYDNLYAAAAAASPAISISRTMPATRSIRRSTSSAADHYHQDEPRAAHRLAGGEPAALRRRPVLPAPDPPHPSGLSGHRPRRGAVGERLPGHALADPAGARRPRLCGVRRVELRHRADR